MCGVGWGGVGWVHPRGGVCPNGWARAGKIERTHTADVALYWLREKKRQRRRGRVA